MATVIMITGIANGKLILEVNGNENRGRSIEKKGELVQWIVHNRSGVESIEDIVWKDLAGSDNIFSDNPPTFGDNNNKRHWKGTVNQGAEDYAVYVYSIKWKRKTTAPEPPDPTIYIFDPIIAIRPSTSPTGLIGFILGLLGLSSFVYWRMERMKMKKEIETLKNKKGQE